MAIVALILIHLFFVLVHVYGNKNLANQLTKTKDKFDKLFNSSLFNFVKIQFATGEIVSTNSGAAKLFGYRTEREFIGHCFEDHFKSSTEAESLKLLILDEGKLENFPIEFKRIDGSTFWGELNAIYFASEGMVEGCITDITSLKETDLKLEAAIKQADAANQAKSAFLATMSHEIRTPISGVIGMLQLAKDTQGSCKSCEYIYTALTSAKTLLGIVNNILDLSKIESGRMELEQFEFNMNEFLLEINSLALSQANNKNPVIDFRIFFDTPIPAVLNTDPTKLSQCLDNIISNAIKFTNDGSVSLILSSDYKNGQHIVTFKVEDTGIGIAPEKQDTLFEPFRQADLSTYRKYGGTGLGLSLTKKMVTLLGGTLEFESRPSLGSTFWITIPAGSIRHDMSMIKKLSYDVNKEERVIIDSPETISILIAEDDPVNQQVISNTLSNAGFRIQITENGQQAIEEALKNNYDIILMDIQMPIKSGLEATSELRNNQIDTPIIALTASVLKSEIQHCFDSGCTDYICKPFEHNDLIKLIAKHTSHTFRISYINNDIKEGKDMDTPNSFKVLNWEDAMNRIGNEDLYIEVAEKFKATASQYIDDLQALIQSNDYVKLSQKAHQIKGAAATISAQSLSHAALELECASKAQDDGDIQDKLCTVMDEFNKLCALLASPDWVDIVKNT